MAVIGMDRGSPRAVAFRMMRATPMRCGNQGVPRQPQYSCVPECRGRPLCLPIRIASAHPPIPWRSRSGCRGRPLCLPIRIVPVATLKKGRHTVQPRSRRIGTLGAPTSSSAHGSSPLAGDRYPLKTNGSVATAQDPSSTGSIVPFIPDAMVSSQRIRASIPRRQQ